MKPQIIFAPAVFACALFAAVLLAKPARAQTNAAILSVRGNVEQPLTLTLSDLQAMPRAKSAIRQKDGGEVTFEGVSLYELVSRAKPRLSEQCCSNAVNTVVVVKAADNYQAVFTLPELDPKYGHREILLADRRDGQLLKPPLAPLQIIVPDDQVHARWVRQVSLIEIMPVGDLRRASTNSSTP